MVSSSHNEKSENTDVSNFLRFANYFKMCVCVCVFPFFFTAMLEFLITLVH
jgi:hypothetical protein